MNQIRKAKHGGVISTIFTLLCIIYVLPILIVIMNSFKLKAYINRYPFQLGAIQFLMAGTDLLQVCIDLS
jgi:raffinose/stachyose/melibiose transport system permease protein